jgi:hypothetical protein
VIGQDNRLSTSKFQALLWTVALGGVLLAIIIANWLGVGDSYTNLIQDQLPEEYLILLGGPFAAAIASKAIVTTKVDNGTITKPEKKTAASPTERLGEALSDDSGNTDLVDTQYLFFNFVALVYFLGAFINDPGAGLPQIPDVLVGLTGVSAATYVSNKAVQDQTPVLASVIPAKAGRGDEVRVLGQHLLIPDADLGGFHPVFVRINGLEAPVLGFKDQDPEKPGISIIDTENARRPFHEKTGADRLWVKVPEQAAPGMTEVVASNFRGVDSETKPFEVAAESLAGSADSLALQPAGTDPEIPD